MEKENQRNLLKLILKSRQRLYTLTQNKSDLSKENIIKKSQELDKLINRYYKNI